MMNKIRVSAVVLTIGLAAAPQLFAESARPEVLVCRDGHVTSTRFGDEACRRHRGIDREATMRARRNGVVYSPNGVYAPNANRGVYGPATTNRGVYSRNGTVYGPATTTNRGVYSSGGTANRPVYGTTNGQRTVYGTTVNPNTNGTYRRDGDHHDRDHDADRDHDDDHDGPGRNGRGHAYGHDKQKHDKGDKGDR